MAGGGHADVNASRALLLCDPVVGSTSAGFASVLQRMQECPLDATRDR